MSLLFRSFLTAAIAILVVIFAPRPTQRVAHAVLTQPVISGGLGILTAIVAPLVLVLIAITIILIPASLLGFLFLALLVVFGWIAIGTEVGERLARGFKQEWALPVSAGLGTFIMTFVADGISRYVECVGWLVPAIVGAVGLGAVLLTRFGTQNYPPAMVGGPIPPASGGPVYPVIPPATPLAPDEPAAPFEPGPVPPASETPGSGAESYPAPDNPPGS